MSTPIRTISACVFVLMSIVPFATHAQMTTDEAFADGLTFGKTVAPTVIHISDDVAKDRIYSYSGEVPSSATGIDATGLHAGGSGDLGTPSVARNLNCMTMEGNPDAAEQNACNAVKTMNDFFSPYTFGKDDPLFIREESAQADPMATLESFGGAGIDLGITETGCVLMTTVIAAPLIEKVCHVYTTLVDEVCTLDRVVEVDTDYLYRCNQSDCYIKKEVCSRSTVFGECTYDSLPVDGGLSIVDYWWCDVCDGADRYNDLGSAFTEVAVKAGNTVTYHNNDYYNETYGTVVEHVWTATGGGPISIGLNAVGNVGSGYVFRFHPGGLYSRVSIDGLVGFKDDKPHLYFSSAVSCDNPIKVKGTEHYPTHYTCPNSDKVTCPAGSTMQEINGNQTCAGNLRCTFQCNSTCTSFSGDKQSITDGFCK